MLYISGEVNSPGVYKYVPGKRLKILFKTFWRFSIDAEKKIIFGLIIQMENHSLR